MGRQDCAVLARAAQNLAAALSSRQQLPSTGSTGGTLRSSSTKKVCATGAGSASPVVSMRMASNRCLRFSSLCRMRMRSPRTAPTGPARASSTELGHQGATGGVPPWAAQVPACPGARRWLPPTRAADAAVVHLEDLLLGLDHQAVVHADLCGERERAGGGGRQGVVGFWSRGGEHVALKQPLFSWTSSHYAYIVYLIFTSPNSFCDCSFTREGGGRRAAATAESARGSGK